MSREAMGRTYGLPVFFELNEGKKAIIGRLLACNYLITVAQSPTTPTALNKGSYVLAWSINIDETRRHIDPLMISESANFTFYNAGLNINFEVHAPVSDMVCSLIPMFDTSPTNDQSGPTTVPSITITDL